MGKTKAIILGVFSVWPVVYYGFFIQMILPAILQSEDPFTTAKDYLPIHLLTILLSLFLFFYYLVKVVRNKELGEQKVWWVLGIIFLNAVAWPVYWYLHIWKKRG